MINYVLNKSINQQKWNNCVFNSINFRVFACSWYLDLICDDWDALILNDYEAVMPLPYRIKQRRKYIYPPFFAPQLGIYSKMPINNELLHLFINSIPRDFKFAEIRLNTQISAPHNLEIESNNTYLLELVLPYEQIFLNFSQNTKRNIKKAEREQLKVFDNGSITELIKLFRSSEIEKKSNFKNDDYHRLEKLMYVHLSMNFGKLYMVYNKQNTLQAGAFFIIIESQAYFLFSGRGGESDKNGAMTYLINEFIRNFSGKNIVLDFCGSNSESLARYYQSFGSIQAHYQTIRVFGGNSFINKLNFKIYKYLKSVFIR